MLSIGALSALREAGNAVPQDVGVIGFNDMEMAGWQNIGLTTIRQPIPEIINAAIDLAVASVDAPQAPPEACHSPAFCLHIGGTRDASTETGRVAQPDEVTETSAAAHPPIAHRPAPIAQRQRPPPST